MVGAWIGGETHFSRKVAQKRKNFLRNLNPQVPPPVKVASATCPLFCTTPHFFEMPSFPSAMEDDALAQLKASCPNLFSQNFCEEDLEDDSKPGLFFFFFCKQPEPLSSVKRLKTEHERRPKPPKPKKTSERARSKVSPVPGNAAQFYTASNSQPVSDLVLPELEQSDEVYGRLQVLLLSILSFAGNLFRETLMKSSQLRMTKRQLQILTLMTLFSLRKWKRSQKCVRCCFLPWTGLAMLVFARRAPFGHLFIFKPLEGKLDLEGPSHL